MRTGEQESNRAADQENLRAREQQYWRKEKPKIKKIKKNRR